MNDRSDAASTLWRSLLEPSTAEAAAAELVAHPAWLASPPPPEVISALGDPRHSYDGHLVALARAWRPAALVPPLLDALDEETDDDRRRRLAWTVKQVATTETVFELLRRATSLSEDRVVRRYLIEAVTRGAAGAADLWPEMSPVVRDLARDPDFLIREAAAALTGSGKGHDIERRALLVDLLADPHEVVVAVAAITLLRFGPLDAADLPEGLATRLLNHPSPNVRPVVQELLSEQSDEGNSGE